MKFIIAFLILTLSIAETFGQTITQFDFQLSDEEQTVNYSPYISSEAGENMEWDFSQLSIDSSYVMQMVHPENTPYGMEFTTSDFALIRSGSFEGPPYTFFDLTSEGWYECGYADNSSYTNYCSDSLPNQKLILGFPCAFDSSWSYTMGDFFSGTTTNIVVDGYGTLLMPYGSLQNVLRVYTHIAHYSIWADNPFRIVVSFYKQGVGIPLLVATTYGHTSPGTPLSYSLEWIANGHTLSISESATREVGVQLYPNPTREKVYFKFDTPGIFKVSIHDVSGHQLVLRNFEHNSLAASNHQSMDVDYLDYGIYLIKIINERGEWVTKRLVIQ